MIPQKTKTPLLKKQGRSFCVAYRTNSPTVRIIG